MSTATSAPLSAFEGPLCALVVGAGRGIGLEVARLLVASPQVVRLFAGARQPLRSPGLHSLRGERGDKLSLIELDVTDEAQVAKAAAQIAASVSCLDLVVNCAGVLHRGPELFPERKLAHVRPANFDLLFRTHAVGPLLLAKHLQPMFPRRERFVFASVSARVGSISDNRLGGWYSYRMSKAAHNMAIKTLSIELARRARGAICLALHPGTVETELSEPFRHSVPRERLFRPIDAAYKLLDVINARGQSDNGGFFAWDGSEIPW